MERSTSPMTVGLSLISFPSLLPLLCSFSFQRRGFLLPQLPTVELFHLFDSSTVSNAVVARCIKCIREFVKEMTYYATTVTRIFTATTTTEKATNTSLGHYRACLSSARDLYWPCRIEQDHYTYQHI